MGYDSKTHFSSLSKILLSMAQNDMYTLHQNIFHWNSCKLVLIILLYNHSHRFCDLLYMFFLNPE